MAPFRILKSGENLMRRNSSTLSEIRPAIAAGRWRRWCALTMVSVCVATLAACGDDDDDDTPAAAATSLHSERNAGQWKPWVLKHPTDVFVPKPPASGSKEAVADLAEVQRWTTERTPEVRDVVARWANPLPTRPWAEMAFDFVSQESKNPPLSSRNYALLHAAIYDAVVTTWYWKYNYKVDAPEGTDPIAEASPDPSYPSEHAAIAGAASRVLALLYPKQSAERLDELADEAALSRVQAGTNTPSDVAAGLDLGRAVADKVIAFAKTDGSDRKWDGKRPAGIGSGPEFWEPPPGSVSPPIEPLAGSWRPWVMTSGDQFRPPPPPAYGSPAFVAAAQEIVDIRKNLTPEQEQIARFYEGAEGTSLPAGIVVNVASEDVLKAATGDIETARLTTPKIARAFALITIALADAGIAAWDAKFTYWNPRPENGINDLGLEAGWKPLLPTPRFPAYPSGSAGYAGAAQAVMTYLFPDNAEEFERRATEQAESRLYAGIHWRYDSASLEAGRSIGALVVERAKADGST